MKTLVGDHRVAIKEGLECVERTEHRELVQMCEEMVESQRREIQQLVTWLCDWYGVWCSEV